MNKKTKIWLVIAASLVLTGCILLGSMMMALDWDFEELSTVSYETNSHFIEEDISGVSIKCNTADIVFAAAQDDRCSVVCYEDKKTTHSVFVNDGTLVIEVIDNRDWYDHIGFFTHTPKITVYLPAGEYAFLSIEESTGDIEIPKEFSFETMDISLSTGDVKNYASASSIKINTTTGDIFTENISADTVEISVSTGDAILTNINCNTFVSTGSTGDITLKNVTAGGSFSIKRTTGDVKFESCDASSLFVETDTGSVTGTLLSDKIFVTQTSTGDVEVPHSTNGGKCEITTSTGDIKITVD